VTHTRNLPEAPLPKLLSEKTFRPHRPIALDLSPRTKLPTPQLTPQLSSLTHSLLSLTITSPLPTTAMLRQFILRSSRAAPRSIVRSTQQRQAHAISNPTLANIEKRWEGMPPQEQADLWMALRDRMKTNWAELTLQEKKAGLFAFAPLPSQTALPRLNYVIPPLQLSNHHKQPIPSPPSSSTSQKQIRVARKEHKLTRIPQTAYYIAFGAHGPRALPPPGEGWKVAGYTAVGVGVSLLLFVGIRMGAKGSPSTMNKEYQEATNEYLKVWLQPPPTYMSLSFRFCGAGSCAWRLGRGCVG
jgi:hypothetical protein